MNATREKITNDDRAKLTIFRNSITEFALNHLEEDKIHV